MKEENLIRSVFKNEITWIIVVITVFYGFIKTVVLPLEKLEIQITQVQVDISNVKTYDARITKNADDIIVLQEELKQFEK